MKGQLFTFLLLLIPHLSNGQRSVVANLKENIAYIGVPNPIAVMAEGVPCKKLTVSTDNGSIQRIENSCTYEFYPERPGPARIFVSGLAGNRQVRDTARFRVKRIPPPVIVVGGKRRGSIRKKILQAQMGIALVLEGFDFDAKFIVEKFRISIYSRDKLVYQEDCIGPYFTVKTKEAFNQLSNGDKILITEAMYRTIDDRIDNLEPTDFTISE